MGFRVEGTQPARMLLQCTPGGFEHFVIEMSESHNKALVRRFLDEVYNQGNLSVADELLAAEYVDHTVPPGKFAGGEGLKRSVAK